MAEKKSPAEGWPVINGDYVVGDPESPVAATTLASHIEQIAVDAQTCDIQAGWIDRDEGLYHAEPMTWGKMQ